MEKLTGEALEDELKEVIRICKKLQNDKSPRGGGVFFPPEEEVYLYDILVDRNIMVENPIEPGGYTFLDEYQRLYTRKSGRRDKPREIKAEDISTVENE